MDRQTLRDWVHRFNQNGPSGLLDRKAPGAKPRLTAEQETELAALIEAGPERDGVVRWRCVDLQQQILSRWNVAYHESTVGKLVKRLGFRHISARPRHHAQDGEAVTAFKTYGPPRRQVVSAIRSEQSASTYPACRQCPGQDGDPPVPVLINFAASSAIF
jgi:transposase